MPRTQQQEFIEVEVLEVKKDDPHLKAILIISEDSELIWIPRSQLHSYRKHPGGVTLFITPWIAKEKGLI